MSTHAIWLNRGSGAFHHDRPEPPDGGGAGGDSDGAEEGRRSEEGRGGEGQVSHFP